MAWFEKFALLMLALICAAQPALAEPSNNPSLSEAERGIRNADAEASEHLRIEELSVTAKVAGQTADVVVEMLIGSDHDSPYEANLALDLPNDAVVTGYALNVGKAMIPGLLLERPKARNLYEAEVRRGIDPGLAEVSAGNRFATRVFPVTRAAPRRIRVTFSAPFDPARGLTLPLVRAVPIARVSFDISVQGYAAAPLVTFGGKTVSLRDDASGWRGSSKATGILREGLTVAGGAPASALTIVQHSGGERFFLIDDGVGREGESGTAERLRIYWDRSLSHGRGTPELETDVLMRMMEITRPAAIDLVTFASDRPTVATVVGAQGLRRALAGITYRGGTSLAGLDDLKLAPASRCILVSDGQITVDRAAEFAPDCALSVLTASHDADGARLGRISQRGGGRFVRATQGGADRAAELLVQTGPQITAVRDGAGRRLAYRALPAGENRFLLVGPMPAQGAVRVRLSDGSERSYRSWTALDADAPGALWAAERVHELGDDPSRHQSMVDLARRYGVAGPNMSLLVLETPDQYRRANLAPPAGFPAAWMEEYRSTKREADEEADEERSERLAFVLNEWAKRKEWWAKSYSAVRRRRPAKTTAAPPPAPSMALAVPVSTPPPNSAIAEEGDSIVVTGTQRPLAPLAATGRRARASEIEVNLADLTANRPYIAALGAASPAARLTVLAEQERAYGSLPSFYLDAADWFRLKGDRVTADLLLLSALELPLSDDETRQIVVFRLERDGHWNRAVELAEHLAAANAEFRPQPQRILALALAARGKARGAKGRADLERAFQLLVDAALEPASSNFDGLEMVALMEANALIPQIEATGGKWALDPRLVALLDTDVRIVIEWTADDADIDLWVDEPNGERVYYGDKLSSAGGLISNDMTDGYGPEEYAIRRARPGPHEVRVHGYDADRLNPNGPGHVQIRLIRNFARPSERSEMVDVDLSFPTGSGQNDADRAQAIATLRVRN